MEGWRSDGGREGGMGVIENWREVEKGDERDGRQEGGREDIRQ